MTEITIQVQKNPKKCIFLKKSSPVVTGSDKPICYDPNSGGEKWVIKEALMDWDDDEFNAGYDEMVHGGQKPGTIPDEASLGGLDPMDISDPASAYFLLSDDAQDEITGTGKKKMKCRACGHLFMGEIYDRCSECFGSDIDECTNETRNRYW